MNHEQKVGRMQSFAGERLGTYRPSRGYRWMTLVAAGVFLLLLGAKAASPRLFLSWQTLLQLGPTSIAVIAGAAYSLQARIEIYENGIREARPLWWDQYVRFRDVERALLPMTSTAMKLFTMSGGQPGLRVDGSTFEDFDRFVLQVVHRLPDDAEIADPAGRIDDFRGGREESE